MKAVFISEKNGTANAIDYDGSYEDIKQLFDEDTDGRCTCLTGPYRFIAGQEYALYVDDEGLYQGYNAMGVEEKGREMLFGPILITMVDEEGEDAGLTDEQCEAVLKAFSPLTDEDGLYLLKEVGPRALCMTNELVLHYSF